jgi:hypothetical protein
MSMNHEPSNSITGKLPVGSSDQVARTEQKPSKLPVDPSIPFLIVYYFLKENLWDVPASFL